MSTAVDSASSTPAAPVNPRNRVIIASLVGTTIEFYDFYGYAVAAVLVFPFLFFPQGDPTVALLSSFAVFGAAMVARPIGAAFYGHLGDRIGRKATLIASLLTMGIATFLIGCLPTFNEIGWFATLLLVVLRLAQGFALGGEWSGAALVATENAPKGKRAWYGAWPQLGAPLGFIIANGLFLIINAALPGENGQPSEAFLSWGWRLPFLLSAVMVIVGLWVRFRLVEAEAFTKASKEKRLVKVPLGEVFRSHWKQIILGIFYMLATYGIFYTVSTWGLTYGTKPAPAGLGDGAEGGAYGFVHFELLLIATCVLFGITTLISGPLADKVGRRKFLIWVTIAIIVFGMVFQPLWSGGIVGTTLWLAIGFTLMGLTFGPQAALLPELFPTNVRYTGSGIAYNISSILGAAITPFVATALVAATAGQSWLVGLYLAGLGVLTLIALFLGTETKDVDIEH
ncbi:MFS transporter [Microbacterium stercoris]|uniref:MHS family MFS transporter n=1 Tax=Microbacterium stercoris TaxID=2820289 RepID=A0A939QLI4_9MICO|nr:MFS transporter [Microbacterium stercoris]MBO3664899.1 MHS family MFS transporter [Microbacterium stercoris]